MNGKSVTMKNVKEFLLSLNYFIVLFEEYVRAKKSKWQLY